MRLRLLLEVRSIAGPLINQSEGMPFRFFDRDQRNPNNRRPFCGLGFACRPAHGRRGVNGERAIPGAGVSMPPPLAPRVLPLSFRNHRPKVFRRSSFNTCTRVCSTRCAPRWLQRICCFFTKRLVTTRSSRSTRRTLWKSFRRAGSGRHSLE